MEVFLIKSEFTKNSIETLVNELLKIADSDLTFSDLFEFREVFRENLAGFYLKENLAFYNKYNEDNPLDEEKIDKLSNEELYDAIRRCEVFAGYPVIYGGLPIYSDGILVIPKKDEYQNAAIHLSHLDSLFDSIVINEID